ncbi:MAG: T9SS type A sorting domain-containing protein [Bacteroidota bacterium]|nr:T9SS type A sorting domain-containing protein [Bacteroidota bacterium]
MRVFYIISIILLTSTQLKSQTNRPAQDPVARVTRFYPNPAVSQITFDIDQLPNQVYSFQVYNFVGKKVLDLPSVNQHTVVNVSDFYRGVYIFQLRDRTGKTIDSGKFQVAH